jgi:hypothetical protein
MAAAEKRTPPPGNGGGADCEAGATQEPPYSEDQQSAIPRDPIAGVRRAKERQLTAEVRARAYEALRSPLADQLADATRLRARQALEEACVAALPAITALGAQLRRDPWIARLVARC